jgi:hypothetical protein
MFILSISHGFKWVEFIHKGYGGAELNEFLCGGKAIIDGRSLNIRIGIVGIDLLEEGELLSIYP